MVTYDQDAIAVTPCDRQTIENCLAKLSRRCFSRDETLTGDAFRKAMGDIVPNLFGGEVCLYTSIRIAAVAGEHLLVEGLKNARVNFSTRGR